MWRSVPSTIFSSASVKSASATGRAAARGEEGGLVDEVGEVGADHARGRGGERGQVDIGGERHAARVDCEDLLAAELVRRIHDDPPVEAPGTQERGVEHFGPVGRGDHDDPFGAGEAVHLGEDLVEGLLALVVAAE